MPWYNLVNQFFYSSTLKKESFKNREYFYPLAKPNFKVVFKLKRVHNSVEDYYGNVDNSKSIMHVRESTKINQLNFLINDFNTFN